MSAASTWRRRRSSPGSKIVVLGGPSLLIGLGGGAASSMGAGASSADLDFASVQRGNPEMQRRAQEVIDACWAMGDDNPILLIHDVGAGGLSNAIPESVHHDGTGGRIDLRKMPERRARHVAARALVQRVAGALRARDRGGAALRVRCALRPRAVPVRGGRRRHGGRAPARGRSSVRQRTGRRAAGNDPRQAAAHDARRAASASTRPTDSMRATCRTCATRPCACCGCRP